MTDSAKPTPRLAGRKVLIFGGSSGLGFATAKACIENGMFVVITSSAQQRVDGAIQRILKDYPSAKDRLSGHACDVGDQATLETNIVQLFEKIGTLDHIIFSAGDALGKVTQPLDQITVDSAVQSHMVRYFAPMIVAKHATSYLLPGPYSSITLTSGTITSRPIPNWILANGVMSALEGLAKALALDLAPIRVNVVQPGFIESEMWGDFTKEDFFVDMKANVGRNLLTGRFGLAEDVAESYLYTLKDANLTGALIRSDGGLLLK